MGLLNHQQKDTQKCQIKRNAKDFLKVEEEEEEEEFHTQFFFTNEHNQHILTNNGEQCKNRSRSRSRSKNIQTSQALKCFQNCLTAFCFLCLFVSTITPTTTTITKTNAVTATILSLTSVLLHVPFIAASSLQANAAGENNKNYAAYFARPWTESLVNGELGVEVDVEPALGVIVNDLERQGTSNEQQLLAFYERAKQKQKQQEKKTLKFHTENYEFDELAKKGGATKRSVSTIATIISKPINATKSSENTLSTPVSSHVTNQPIYSTTKRALESLSSVIADGELGVQESTLLEDKCEPKVLNSVPMEPFFDFTETIKTAAHQFTEYLSTIKLPTTSNGMMSDELRDEVYRRANIIAGAALEEDDNLLAFAIAAPQVHTVVVKFKDNVTIPPEEANNKSYLGAYWRVLGQAWNSSNENVHEWTAPFRDCKLLKGRWMWPFRLSYTEFKIKIVLAVFIAADEDVCNDGLSEIFGRRHGCDRNTTFCLLMENKPLPPRDVYTCICKDSFYLPNSTLQGFRGDLAEMSEGYDNYSCMPCPGMCTICNKDGECLFGEPQEAISMENLFKVTVGIILGACILCCIVFSIIVFQQRKSKAIASGMWTVLETILLGIVLLYLSVAVHFFSATVERCLIEPWLRELGFITCYGAIILKIYRHLVDFRTRKAHRWVLRDVDLLKYLGTMVFAVICYMAAFTASSLDLLKTSHCLEESLTNTCHPLKWEYVTQASEMLILCFGLHLCFASRNANTQFRERQFLVVTLVIEFLISSTFYVLRYIYLQEMSPDAMFLALFVRSQLTNTVALALIFVPKLWYQHKQVSPYSRHYEVISESCLNSCKNIVNCN